MSFLGYFSYCYRKSRGSIFIGGLVGGMFLSFLMDEDEKCHDRWFTTVFFVIGILHFLSNTLSGAAAYAKKAREADQEVTLLERKCQLFIIFLQHLVKLAQYPMVIWLSWYIVQFSTEVSGAIIILTLLHPLLTNCPRQVDAREEGNFPPKCNKCQLRDLLL